MKTAFITGSSRGIGRAIAIRLAKDGFKVIIHGATNSRHLESLKEEIEKKGGVAETLSANLMNIEETGKLSKMLTDVDILVLNASVQYRTPCISTSEEIKLQFK